MKMGKQPRVRKDGLVVQPLIDETLIYDKATHDVHCLNRTATLVWKYADGKHTVTEIAQSMSSELHSPVDEAVVSYTLGQLKKRDLLDNHAAIAQAIPYMTRREFLRLVPMGAALVPVVASIVAPQPAEAQSFICTDIGGFCLRDSDCCTGLHCTILHRCEMGV